MSGRPLISILMKTFIRALLDEIKGIDDEHLAAYINGKDGAV